MLIRGSRLWSLLGLLALGTLVPSSGEAGIFPFPWHRNAPPRMTQRRAEREAEYAERACEPIGSKQFTKHGKQWPPYPRPTGPANPPSHLYHAAHYWPHPYTCEDREYVRALSGAQVSNGWVTMTTLYDYHFEPNTHQLNPSGRMHVRWILENAPARHRYIFVQAAVDQAGSETRVVTAKNEAVALVGDEQIPPVMIRVASPVGRPAEEIDAVRRLERESTLKPRISPPVGGGTAGSAASSSK